MCARRTVSSVGKRENVTVFMLWILKRIFKVKLRVKCRHVRKTRLYRVKGTYELVYICTISFINIWILWNMDINERILNLSTPCIFRINEISFISTNKFTVLIVCKWCAFGWWVKAEHWLLNDDNEFVALFTCIIKYEGWNFNSGNYLFTTDTK